MEAKIQGGNIMEVEWKRKVRVEVEWKLSIQSGNRVEVGLQDCRKWPA